MWSVEQLADDARGYGLVVCVLQGRTMKHVNSSAGALGRAKPLESEEAVAGFLGRLYAVVETDRPITVYRFYDEGDRASARLLGAWWSPKRPGLAIDRLGLPSFHNTARDDLALKTSWNRMMLAAEATLRPGALIYVGRVAPQTEPGRLFGGGAVQFFVPRSEFSRLHYMRRHTAR